VWPELLPDPVHEERHAAASTAQIDVEVFLVNEQLAKVAEDAPASPLVKIACADVFDAQLAARAELRIVRMAMGDLQDAVRPSSASADAGQRHAIGDRHHHHVDAIVGGDLGVQRPDRLRRLVVV
jgi:hypothetical protein